MPLGPGRRGVGVIGAPVAKAAVVAAAVNRARRRSPRRPSSAPPSPPARRRSPRRPSSVRPSRRVGAGSSRRRMLRPLPAAGASTLRSVAAGPRPSPRPLRTSSHAGTAAGSKPLRRTTPDEATAAAYDAIWTPDAPAGDAWTARPWVHPGERAVAGKAARKRVARTSHATYRAVPGRDPIAILEAQEADRLPELVPLRHERMAESAFAYFRGTPAVMAFDLAGTPRSDIPVQASGDAHISNFGLFAVTGTSARLRRQRLRRDAARAVGVGSSSAWRPASRSPDAPTASAPIWSATRRWRASEAIERWMARYAAMRLIDVLYAADHRGRSPGRG